MLMVKVFSPRTNRDLTVYFYDFAVGEDGTGWVDAESVAKGMLYNHLRKNDVEIERSREIDTVEVLEGDNRSVMYILRYKEVDYMVWVHPC